MFRFESPQFLYWLWLVPSLFIISWLRERSRKARLETAVGAKLTPFLTASVSGKKRSLKLFLKCMALFWMIVALARPQMGEGRQEIKSRGVELIVAMDVSQSMLCEDVRPNRLELSKKQVSRLLDRLHGDKVGLIAFAGASALISPLTADYSAIRLFLESLDTDSVSTQGTNFGLVLKEAFQAFKRGGVGEEEGSKVTKVLLVITDGEDHEPGAVELAREYTKKGMRIITYGVGTRKGGPVPIRDRRGNLSGYLKDKNGQPVVTATNEKALQEIASAGRGGFYFSSFEGGELDDIKKEIDQLEKSEFESDFATLYNDRFQVALWIALIFVFLDFILGERNKMGRIWRGRFEVMET